jgi:NADH:ubiquinone oxidoreductase subunit 3 (subunit A)
VDGDATPEEQAAWQAGVERIEQEKREALRAPGPSWHDWFFYDNAKWWVGLLFLVFDVWIAGTWIDGGNLSTLGAVGLALSLVLAVYLEYLAWGYLWRRPALVTERSHRLFRPNWRALREFGRWTPEGAGLRGRGSVVAPEDGSPNPREFL